MTDHLNHAHDPGTDGIICAATLADAAADPALTLDTARELLREAAEAIRCLHQYRDAMGGQGEGRYPCPRGCDCRGRDCPDCANFTAPHQPEAQAGGAVAAGEPSAAAMAQAFIERYESRYTPHTVELVMAEVRARARELDTTPPAKVPEGWAQEVTALLRDLSTDRTVRLKFSDAAIQRIKRLLAAAPEPGEGE